MFNLIVGAWNGAKSGWSRLNDWLMGGADRRPIPAFATPAEAARYLMDRALYTGDPLSGAADFYLHPTRLQAALEGGREALVQLSIDCDDYASWAYAALDRIPNCTPFLFTLRDANGWGHHVICVYRWNLRYGAIDTNGHRELPDLAPETLCRVWSEIYQRAGYRYVEAISTPYPF